MNLLIAGVLLIFVLPVFALCVGWFVVFCYQQASQDFMHHCFDPVNRHYWASIRLGTTEPLIIYLLLFPLFFVAVFFFYQLVKEFKANQQYFETDLNEEEREALQKIQKNEKNKRKEELETNNETEDKHPPIDPVPVIVAKRSRSNSRSRSRSGSRSSYKSKSKSPKSKKHVPVQEEPKPPSKKPSRSPSPKPADKAPSPESSKKIIAPVPVKPRSPEPDKKSLSSKSSNKKIDRKVSSESEDSNRVPVELAGLGLLPSDRSDKKLQRKKKKKRRRQRMNENPRDDYKPERQAREKEPERSQRKVDSSDEDGFDFTQYYNNIIKDEDKQEKKNNRFTDKVRNQGQKHELSKFISKLKPKGRNKNPGLKKKPTFMNDIFSIVGNKGQSRFHQRK